MRPAPIPDTSVWPGSVRKVIAPPGGDLDHPEIAPVEAVVDVVDTMDGQIPRLSVRCVLEDGDLARLAEGGHVWISFYGQMVPFSTDVTGPEGP